MTANTSHAPTDSLGRDRRSTRGREARKDPHDDPGAPASKAVRHQEVAPDDQRGELALQFVLSYAPPDTEWSRLWEVYTKGLDPREVWADE